MTTSTHFVHKFKNSTVFLFILYNELIREVLCKSGGKVLIHCETRADKPYLFTLCIEYNKSTFHLLTYRVVTLDVFRENHVRKTLSGRVRTNVRVGRPPADGKGGRPLVDGPWRMAIPTAECIATLQRHSQEHLFSFIESFIGIQVSEL
jgi:hypothetical protein